MLRAAGGARSVALHERPTGCSKGGVVRGDSSDVHGEVDCDSLAAVVVAIDGPSGSGKSSTARGVARRLGLRYLDTGAMFRALTWWMLQQGVDVEDARAVASRVDEADVQSGTDPDAPTITVDGVDVAGPIRSAEVTASVSAVSAVREVRSRLLSEQREIIGTGGIVVEGRDIGSVVAPDARVKVYLTADAGARAARRTAETSDTAALSGTSRHAVRGDDARSLDMQRDLERRDRLDSGRATAPLVMADGAHHIDTTPYSLDEVIDRIVELVDQARTGARL